MLILFLRRATAVLGVGLLLWVVGSVGGSGQLQPTWIVCPQGWPWCHFSSVQQAVDAASPGDTIFIRAGTYRENLLIRKDLTLIGEWPDRVLIQSRDPGHPVIAVSTLEPEDIFAALLGVRDLPSITSSH